MDTPEPVRQIYEDDLKRICELLRPETSIQNWQAREQRAQLESHQRIETAYTELKAELLEQARIRKQRALEKSLAKKRADQAAYNAGLYEDEAHQFHQQTEQLYILNQMLSQETLEYSSRYHKNPELPAIDYAQKYFLKVQDEQILTELESVRLRLELEADTQIEQAVSAFRARLQAAAHEEIEYILKNTKFKTSIQD
nr:hypothetical protein [Acinetobacter radioresistens]